MTENPLDRRFALIADHLESLAASLQDVEELQEQDRRRREQDSSRIDRLERLFKLMIRIGDRERKELRERLNALIDAQMRSEAVFANFQQKSDERMTRLEESNAQFQAQVGDALARLADATAHSYRRLDALESQGNG